MSILRKIKERAKRRALRVRKKIKIDSHLPRVSVHRTLKHMYVQIIDDNAQKTLVSCSSLELKDAKGDKKAIALAVGKELAKKALDKGIKEAVFDRGSFLFHGRVEALAQGLKDGGMKV